ncbi:MAG: outer membrane protein assembly factor BamC [Gammaproteobacteria bacterium]|jgi:outer membrane protein assembly factor BamC
MKKLLTILFLTTSCSYISGPEGLFPPTKNAFLKEKVEEDMLLPNDIDIIMIENHYPVEIGETLSNDEKVPKPRQIFASSGNSSVQLRRLGELMWIYVETLPSTSWPITKSYWNTSSYETISANPQSGEIIINFDEGSFLNMKIEHGIKEASTEIFLTQIDKNSNEIISNPDLIQSELSSLVSYFADTVDQFTGTSLAAQNLNDLKKTRIFVENGRTVIELDLNFDRAWSSVTKAMDAAEIFANDKDRSNGIFYVSYVEEDNRGFLSFLNPRKNEDKKVLSDDAQFEVKIIEKNNKTYVRAYSKDGKIDESEKLISKINESLS